MQSSVIVGAMAEVDLKRLVASRGYLKTSITRLYNFANDIQGISSATIEALDNKRKRTYQVFSDYEEANKSILYLDPEDKEDVNEVETKYFHILGVLDKQIKLLERTGCSNPSATALAKVKLPEVHIQNFTGKFSEYIPFINIFMSMVNDNKSLDSVQKLYYLRSFVKNEPYDLIKNLPLVSDSYSQALKILNDRYNNEEKIINDHINYLLDLKPLIKSTGSSLRNFLAAVKQQLAALENIEPNVNSWDAILLCVLYRKLDLYTVRAYQLERDTKIKPKLADFLEYIEKRALALENVEQEQAPQRQGVKVVTNTAAGKQASCLYCQVTDHKLYNCKKFHLLPTHERVQFATNNKLCNKCLGAHSGKCRFHFRCKECKQEHNTLLHCDPTANALPVTSLTGNTTNDVLLPTAKIKIVAHNGSELQVKALLDSGSQLSFVTSSLVQVLGLEPTQIDTNIIGITNMKNTIRFCLPIEIHSLNSPFKSTVTCQVVDRITCKLPQVKINISEFNIPTGTILADDNFYKPSEIQVLLGADVFFHVLMPLELPASAIQEPSGWQSSPYEPRIINTQFGHIIAGGLPEQCRSQVCNKVTLKCIDCTTDLSETLSNFWKAESVPAVFNEHISEHQLCESIFKGTVQLKNNIFQVVLPLKLPLSEVNDTLGDSFNLALKRFLNLEKKLHKNSSLFIEYQKFIHEYLALGHGHYVDIDSYHFSKDPVYFLPHHAVIKEDSKTTKLRAVFDGSMKTNKRLSLNDLMLNGPSVQRDLFDIIMLFRFGQYTFTTDIKRMFRNVQVSSDYTSLQNILWRDHPNESVKCIRLDTVTYGLKSSTYLATGCLNELACMYEQQFPLASSILKNSTYVDDVIYSHNSLQTVLEAKSQLCNLLSLGSFLTHKWASNDARILTDVPSSDQHFGSVDLQKENYNLKALGLLISMNEDQFKISSPQLYDCNEINKQQILSYIGRFYDPMGFISPIIVKAKAIMQKLWLSKVSWTATPPESITQEWLQFVHSLASMGTISLNRNVQVMDSDTVHLIGFADASSSTAYGCCVYLRVMNKSGKVNQYLLCSKSRINPLNNKNMTVPRLELNAALLLSKLIARVHSTLKLKINIHKVYLFSDSQIVLAWISKEPISLKAYVANRVNVINQLTANWTWMYVDTRDNPADLISRGVNPQDLASCNMWWQGPQFLLDGMYSFVPNFNSSLDVPEVKSCSTVSSNRASATQEVNDTFDRLHNISNINKMTRVLAYIFRFYNNIASRNSKISNNYLTSTELKHSLMLIIKHEQQVHYKKEIDLLLNNLSIKGSLKSLHPFLDELGLLRVGGRLHYANIPFEQKHPVLLPKGSQITYLIIKKEHERLLHAGPKLLLSNLNQRFWIIDGLRVVKKITHQCIVCFRQKATASRQLMGSLPADRVTATSRPFKKIGVDFAGPISVKNSRVRRAIIGKGYICVFVCFATKAIHLELASDLTTNTFLACLRRLVARRGLPTEIHCDNASTFKGARNQLVELYNLQASKDHQTRVHEYAAQEGINFNFIPSYSPTFGGLWEAAVKSTKYHLKRILQHNVLTYEQLNTVLIETEAVLNSRPLLPLSASDVNDFSHLTPAHFIIGESLTMYPELDTCNVPYNRLAFWQQCTNLKQSFWKMWHKQYLNLLQNRPKWLDTMRNIKIGSLVILREDNTPPLSWPMARVINVFPGHDGKVRTVEVKTPNGKTHVRSITKVSVLPLEQAD